MNRFELKAINDKIIDKIEEVLEYFGYEYIDYPNRISMPCPIHGSDNEESLTIFKDGYSAKGNWNCWTGGCHDEIITHYENGEIVEKPRENDLFSLIRSFLELSGKTVSTMDAVKWCAKFVKHQSNVEKYINKDFQSQDDFIKQTKLIKKKEHKVEYKVSRYNVRRGIVIPAQYYVGRGYSSEILDKYDVGFCGNKTKPMYNRAVVPIYDNNHNYAIAFTGRSINPQCTVCSKYHPINERCPDKKDIRYVKWRHSNFHASKYLYNYWFSKKYILETGVAIIVEGPGDVWKLEEAGFHNGVGIFGDSISDMQISLLNEAGALNLIILTDNDKAGLKAKKNITNKCKRAYNCICPEITKKDIGETSIEDIQKILNPILRGL